jgi:hypothetical protein
MRTAYATLLLPVDDQTIVSTSIVSLRLTIFAFSAEEIQIVAIEDLLMNAQVRRTEPYPGVFKRVHSSTIEKSMIDLQLFIGPLPKLHYRRLALKWQLVSFPRPANSRLLACMPIRLPECMPVCNVWAKERLLPASWFA